MESTDSKLNVLLSAYACEPGKGSEPGVGWNVARELSDRVNLWVITRANNQRAIENSGEDWTRRVQWIYWDPPRWLTFWKKGGRGVQLFYILWQAGLKAVAERVIAAHPIDVVHHLTFGKYWIPSRLAGLSKPFVFGPVGGGEFTPPGLRAKQSARGRLAEFLKKAAIHLIPCWPGAKGLYRDADWTFAATPQTQSRLEHLGVRKVSLLPQSGIRPSDLSPAPAAAERGSTSSELQLVTAARLIHWKAIDLAIEAVALAAKEIPVKLAILQTGPELGRLKELALRLGVQDRVEFKGRLATLGDVYQEISTADALVHPALHEAFGQSCLEALALGVPVICLDWAGPGLIVDRRSGFAVEPSDRPETVRRLSAAMVSLYGELQTGTSRRDDCVARAFGEFSWARLTDGIVEQYSKVTARPN